MKIATIDLWYVRHSNALLLVRYRDIVGVDILSKLAEIHLIQNLIRFVALTDIRIRVSRFVECYRRYYCEN